MEGIILLAVVAICLLLTVPIGISIACAIILTINLFPVTNVQFVAQTLYSGFNSFPLLAIPCFMLAGEIMKVGGLSKRLVNVANKLIGNNIGGLGSVTIVACLFFGAISGSAPATVAAIGSIMIPSMVRCDYDREYSTGLVAVSGGLGVIVPPSIPLVVYGVATATSISRLFIAGFGPALLIALGLIIVNYFLSKRKGWKGTGEVFNLKVFLKTVLDAFWALLMPIIILGGIYSGVFTPTEASVVAVVFGAFVGVFVYKELTLKELLKIFDRNLSFIGGILFTFAPAAALGAILVLLQIPDQIIDFLMSISTNKYIILLIINIFLIFVGMILDPISSIIILAPILLVLMEPLGVDPIHLGIIMTVNLAIGFVTPPVAGNLFVASKLTGISVERISQVALPFIICCFICLLIITFIPNISLGLVKLFM